jgi:hypothetical protein
MKNTFLIFAIVYIIALMTSCASNSKRHHARKHGLVQHGCGGLSRLPGKH